MSRLFAGGPAFPWIFPRHNGTVILPPPSSYFVQNSHSCLMLRNMCRPTLQLCRLGTHESLPRASSWTKRYCSFIDCALKYLAQLTHNLREGWSLRSAGDGNPAAGCIVGCGVLREGFVMLTVAQQCGVCKACSANWHVNSKAYVGWYPTDLHVAWLVDVSSLWNDLYCVGWGVKLYSLTHLVDVWSQDCIHHLNWVG